MCYNTVMKKSRFFCVVTLAITVNKRLLGGPITEIVKTDRLKQRCELFYKLPTPEVELLTLECK